MFTVRVAVQVRPEGRDEFLSQLRTEEDEVPVRFEGCERFAVYSSPHRPTEVLVYEEWESRSAFEAYRSSDYFRDSGSVLFPLMDGAPDSAYFVSERVGP